LNAVELVSTIQRISTVPDRRTGPASTNVRGWCLPKNCPKKAISGMKKCPCKLLVKEENRRKATLVAGKKPNEKSQIV
jgi:hypothetical protein